MESFEFNALRQGRLVMGAGQDPRFCFPRGPFLVEAFVPLPVPVENAQLVTPLLSIIGKYLFSKKGRNFWPNRKLRIPSSSFCESPSLGFQGIR